MTSTTDRWRLILVPHTHWDREWYFPYQRYRTRLVGFFDLLLDILERDPEYRHFMLDGHTILLEDYLEVRPDRRDQIARFVREDRLAVGPWYEIPDHALPGGEALVRNLLRGHRVAAQFGEPMKVGYVPDPFGQIAHLPALLRGFGIDRCTFWRGADRSLDTTEFVWEAPDGSDVLVVHMAGGYGIGGPFPVDDEATFLDRIERIRALLQPLARTRTLLAMWGGDHVAPQDELSSLVRAANRRLADAEVVHAGLPALFDELDAQLDRAALPRRCGEFRSGERSNVLPGVLSTRMWIKQRTFDAEQLLTRWAEPLTVWGDLLRQGLGEAWREPPLPAGPVSPYPKEAPSEWGLLDRAWRLLLENQPHDSICGCSVDQTHEEMRPRFDQCDQVGDELTYQAMRRIGANGPAERVYVFNPLPGPRTDFAKAVVPAKPDAVPVALVDDAGRRWPCQEIERTDPRPGRVTVGFVAGDVPGFGYRTYDIEYGRPPARPPAGPRIENECFAVEVDPRDGTLTVEDRRDGRRYEGLNRLVDGGDRGDEYNYCPPDDDVLVDTPSSPPEVRVLERGPARSTLEVRMTYRLPAALTARRRRSERTVSCGVRVLVHLHPGVPRVDIRTEVDNRAEDHRLRALFPSGVTTGVSHAEQHFGVVERPVALPPFDETWQELPVGTHPQKTFVDVNDGSRGLLVANRGLPEYEVLDTPGGATIALTLLRCVGWLSRDDLSNRKGHAGPPLETPGAQCPGRHAFEYALVPHDGGWQRAYAEAHRFAVPMRGRWNPARGGASPDATLTPSASLFDLEGDGLVVTAIKRPETGDGVIVRLYNTLDTPTAGRLRLTAGWQRVDVVDMKEDRLVPVDVRDGWAHANLRPNEILTLRFR